MKTVVTNIGQLMLVPKGPISGPKMGEVETLDDAAIVIEDGRFSWIGNNRNLPDQAADTPIIDAAGGCAIPGLIDCHTHTIFAGSREHEFAMRCGGQSYEDIARSGGGIRTTVRATRDATKDELIELAERRLRRMIQLGVTTVEIKSGYGLSVEQETKMLECCAELDSRLPLELVGTYLAAHTVPPEFEDDPGGYLTEVMAQPVLKKLVNEGLAEFCDVFCENIAFGLEHSRRVLFAAKKQGLIPKVHADQITQMGASQLAAEMNAISADHLEQINEAGIAAMRKSGTIAVLLPACSFFLGVDQADARRLMTAGLPIAVATDFNPGSSMVNCLPLAMSIACTQMKMTPTEVLVATTANAAAALNRQNRLGAIEVGMQADLAIVATPNFDRFCYEVGQYDVPIVIKNGIVVVDSVAQRG